MAALVAGEKARMYALGGIARGGATRGGYHSPQLFVAINGVHYATGRAGAGQIVDGTLTIANAKPNRCNFEMRGVVVSDGAEAVVTMGTKNSLTREFAGNVSSRTVSYVGTPANQTYQINAIDFEWALNSLKVTKRYTNMSGSLIGRDLMTFAPGFTALHVENELPVLDEITFTDKTLGEALDQLATRLGATRYIDFFRDLHLFTSELLLTNPRPLLDGDTPRLESFSATFDSSQFISRMRVEGGGVNALTDVAPGETNLPVEGITWYEASGVVASGPQRLTYTGLRQGGTGSLVGPGAAPSSAPTSAAAAGTGVAPGVYKYVYTDVTAAGETLPGPLASITIIGSTAAPRALSVYGAVGGGVLTPGTYLWATTFVTASGETTASPTLSITLGGTVSMQLFDIPTGPPVVTARKLYRTTNGGAQLKLVATIADNTTVSYNDNVADGSLGANVPTVNTATEQQVALSGIALGPSGTTARNVYRTVVGGSQLKLQQVIANNTATVGVQDATADGSLGANAPTSDTSGLTQPAGQVNAGTTALLLASAGPFSSTGGWAQLGGGQVVRYTGITGNTLTGIPASGPGAILTTVLYGSQAVAAPELIGIPATGVGSIVYTIKQGDPVNLVVQVDDVAAQALLAALLTTATYTHSGIIEDVVVDHRLSATEARARGQSQLALRNQVDVSAHVISRDFNMRMGRTQTVNLSAMGINQDLKVQMVTVSGFTPAAPPYYDATLSSDLFSFEDLLRMARKDVH